MNCIIVIYDMIIMTSHMINSSVAIIKCMVSYHINIDTIEHLSIGTYCIVLTVPWYL